MPEHIRIATTDEEISACLPVILELRPDLDPAGFVGRVRRQEHGGGYRIAFRSAEARVVAMAGFRILENLAWGRFLYVDDLVTRADARSRGHGSALLRWLEAFAADHACGQLHLDSGTQRTSAHRFYDREGYARTSFHFAKIIAVPPND